MSDINMWTENKDYETIPHGDDNDQSWAIRILKGDFIETTLVFGNISFEDESVRFNFNVVSTPDESLTVDNMDLQDVAGQILEDVLVRAMSEGSLVKREK